MADARECHKPYLSGDILTEISTFTREAGAKTLLLQTPASTPHPWKTNREGVSKGRKEVEFLVHSAVLDGWNLNRVHLFKQINQILWNETWR